MSTPEHPGLVLARRVKPLRMNVGELADALGVSRKTLSALLNGRQAVSPEMAVRLSIALDTSPDEWLRRQTAYDLAAVDRDGLQVRPLKRRTR